MQGTTRAAGTNDNKSIIGRILASYSDSEIHMLTWFYRQRLEEVMVDQVMDLASVLEKILKGSQYWHIRQLVTRNQTQEASRYVLGIVNGASARVQRATWEAVEIIQDNNAQLKRILGEIQEKGKDLLIKIFRTWCEVKVPEELRIQKQHKATLRSQNEKLTVNTLRGREKAKTFLLSDRYTELIVTSSPRDRRLVEHELVARGKDHEEWQQTNISKLKPNQLFRSNFGGTKSRTTILSGIAGIGKTTLVQNILYRWATGKIYSQFHFVLHFKFRDLNRMKGETSLKTLVLESYPYVRDVLEKIWENPERLLFVFDGLDEFKDRIEFRDKVGFRERRKNPAPKTICSGPDCQCLVADIVRSLVKQDVLKGCSVLITSRPTALESLADTNTYLWAEILGFFAEGREDYIRRFFADEKMAAEVLRYVKENEILYTMCFNPSYCWILCCTLEPIFNHPDGKQPPPKTITQLYSSYIYNILKNHPRDSENPREVMRRAGEMAYQGVCNRNIVFDEEHFYRHQLEPSTFISGFMMEILEKDDGGRVVVYTFPHLTVQEFVAALAQYLTPVRRNMVEMLEQVHKEKDGRFEIFLRFAVGLSWPHTVRQLEEILGPLPQAAVHETISWLKVNVEKAIKQSGSKDGKRNLLNMMYYLFESQNNRLAQITLGAVETLNFTGFTLNPLDCAVLSHVLQLCDTVKDINLDNCNIGAEGIQRLVPALHKCQHLRLQSNNLGDSGVKSMCEALRNPECKIHTLELGDNNLGDSGVKSLCEALRNPECKIQTLGLGGNNLGDSGVKSLCEALRNPECKIQKLGLGSNKLGDSGVKSLCEALRNPECKIQSLVLGDNNLGDSGVKSLCEALRNPECKIQTLGLGGNNLGDSGVKSLCEALRNPECKIQKLGLGSNKLGDSGVKSLCEALRNPECKIQSLVLGGNNLGDSGVKSLCEALRNPECKIQTLGLDTDSLTDDCAEDLISNLSTSRSLTQLDLGHITLADSGVKLLCEALRKQECKIHIEGLGGNNLGDSGVKSLCEALSNLECKIQRLWLYSNSLTDGCTDQLVSALSTSRSLRGLDLEANSFTDASVPALRRLTLTCTSLEWIRLRGNLFSSAGQRHLASLEESRAWLSVTVR